MPLTTRPALLALCAVAALGLAGACGNTSSSGGKPAAVAGASTAASGAAGTATGGNDADQFCTVVKREREQFLGNGLSGLLSGGGADAWRDYLAKMKTMNQELVDAAPDELQPSVKILQQTTLQLNDMMVAAHYDIHQVNLRDVLNLLQSQEHKDATAKVVSYVKDHCDIDLSTVS